MPTTATTHERASDISILAWTGAIASIWLMTAVFRPDTTLHLGPILVPLVPALLGREAERPVRLVLIGTLLGAGVLVMLMITGNLNGPALNPFPDAIAESVILLGVGGLTGLILVRSTIRR